MRHGRFGLGMGMIALGLGGTLLGGVVGLVDYELWIEPRWRDTLLLDRWIESPLEWFYLGVLTAVAACVVLAVGSLIRAGRFPGMTVRHWMAIVAATALILGEWEAMRNRANRLQRIAASHGKQREKILFRDLDIYLLCTPVQRGDVNAEREVSLAMEPVTFYLEYQYDMQNKYERAADRPWNWIAADPPAPTLPSRELQNALRARYLEPMLRDIEWPQSHATDLTNWTVLD